MPHDSALAVPYPAVSRKKVTAAFDGGRLSSDSGVASIRLRLLKLAGRFSETASRIRVALASCCPEAELFSLIAFRLQTSGP